MIYVIKSTLSKEDELQEGFRGGTGFSHVVLPNFGVQTGLCTTMTISKNVATLCARLLEYLRNDYQSHDTKVDSMKRSSPSLVNVISS